MTFTERLKKLLDAAGIDAKDQEVWLRNIYSIPFQNAEVFLYILERMERDDIAFFNRNLKDKIAAIHGKDELALAEILRAEVRFLENKPI
ncbi:MAG: hypothetical protein UY56_C0024G0012 [Parcubacteria group bacterium GW2011_GWA1_50_14]|nr:MAG: hypothetical protein UY56_C0024G0012 [Parcubacteria group bacterium GW2011_GWA1_50_14]